MCTCTDISVFMYKIIYEYKSNAILCIKKRGKQPICGKQPKSPSTGEQIKKAWSNHTME